MNTTERAAIVLQDIEDRLPFASAIDGEQIPLLCLKTAIKGLLVQLPASKYIGKGNATELLTALCDQWEAKP